jgi:hypothetical protein
MPTLYQSTTPPSRNVTRPAVGGPFVSEQSIDVTISSAQLLALHSSPVQILPASDPGTFIHPLRCVIRYYYGGTAYAGTVGVLQFIMGTAAPLTGILTTLNTANIGVTASSVEIVGLGTAQVSAAPPPISTFDGQPLNIWHTLANATTGNGTLHVTVYYATEIIL